MKMQLVLKKKKKKKEKDEKMMKIEVARVYKSLKGLWAAAMSLCNSCEDVFMFQRLGSDLAFSLEKLYFFVFLYLFCICGGDI